MQKYVYMVVTHAGNPLTIDYRLPIYWRKKFATEVAEAHSAKVVRMPTPTALEQAENGKADK